MALPINIEDLLNKQKVESNRIEFKKGWNPAKIYQTICAFANDFDNIGGGYILVGVEEENGVAKRPIHGLSESELDSIQKAMIGFNNKINPYYLPRTSVEKIDGKYILVIWVPSGLERPYDVMDDVTKRDARPRWYVRSGTSTIEAKGEVLTELREMANRIPFDDRGNSAISLEDLSPVLIMDYLRRVKSRLLQDFSTTPLSKSLEQMEMWVGPSERRYLKNVAAMMFCEFPEKFFPYTQVEIVHFPGGAEREPNNMIETPLIKGSVPTIIRATLHYLKTNVIQEQIIKPKNRAESIRFFNYPYQALEEAVVNALYHRDYQVREPVEITIEPHAISILSHSGPDRSISEESIRAGRRLQTRRYRNRRLGEFLKELDLSEGRATGIPTIQEELKRNGSPLASFDTDSHRTYFLITIPCHPDFVSKKMPLSNDADTINDTINDKQRRERLQTLISLIRQGEVVSAKEMAIALSVSTPTVWRDIKTLRELGIKINTRDKWTVDDTLNDTDNDTLNDTVNDTLNDTVNDTLNDTVNDTLNDTVNDTLNDTVNDTLNDTVESKIKTK